MPLISYHIIHKFSCCNSSIPNNVDPNLYHDGSSHACMCVLTTVHVRAHLHACLSLLCSYFTWKLLHFSSYGTGFVLCYDILQRLLIITSLFYYSSCINSMSWIPILKLWQFTWCLCTCLCMYICLHRLLKFTLTPLCLFCSLLIMTT